MGELNGLRLQNQAGLVLACNIVTPVGMLGYGLDEQQTSTALIQKIRNGAPTAIILDSGSTDSGPEKLALGVMTAPRSSYVRDLTKLIRLAYTFHVPLIFSSAGGDGSDDHVRELVSVIEEIARMKGNEHYRLKTIALFSEVTKTLVSTRRESGAIHGCGKAVPALTAEHIISVPRIVSQMGPEPFYDAMTNNPGFNIIVGGRSYDPSPYIAYAAYASGTPLKKNTKTVEGQQLWGGFTHMGKIMECGGHCSTPKSSGASATVYRDGTFDVTPFEEESRCTKYSVSAHTLYEKSRPDLLYGPGGWLDLTASQYEELEDGRSCRVRGGLFTFSRDAGLPYEIKLEAASIIGYRSHFMGSFRDPILISQLDDLIARIKDYVQQQHKEVDGTWDLDFHIYGQHQISTLPETAGQPAEVFIIGEALASSQQLATSVASTARVASVHGPYKGQKATSGNLAYGHGGKMEVELGPCAQFSIYHLMALEEGEERLRINPSGLGIFTQSVNMIGVDISSKPIHALSIRDKTQSKANGMNVPTPSNSPKVTTDPPRTLGDVARVLRSKNAGPFEITFDVIFGSPQVFELVKESEILNTATVASLFQLQEDDVIWSGFFDQALAYKATIPRLWNGKPTASGGFMENDVHGSQKYIGLMNMKLPESFLKRWSELHL